MKRNIARVFLLAVLAAGPARAQSGNSNTVITADSMSFDYRRYVAVFQGHVVVQDPQVRMESEQLNIRFDEKDNSLKWVTAIGRVKLTYQEKSATCDKAVYMQSSGEVVLMGNARLGRGKDSVSGDKITFWLNEDRMVCEGQPKLVIYPTGSRDANPLEKLGFERERGRKDDPEKKQ